MIVEGVTLLARTLLAVEVMVEEARPAMVSTAVPTVRFTSGRTVGMCGSSPSLRITTESEQKEEYQKQKAKYPPYYALYDFHFN
jgi:hypothetical protein